MKTKNAVVGALTLGLALGPLAMACSQKEKKAKRPPGADKQITELQQGGDQLQTNTEDLLSRRGKLQTGKMAIKEARKLLEAKRAGLAKDDLAGHQAVAKEEAELRAKENKLRKKEEQANKKLMAALADQRNYLKKATAALTRGGGSRGDGTASVKGRKMSLAVRARVLARRVKDLAEREAKYKEVYGLMLAEKSKACPKAPKPPAAKPTGKDPTKKGSKSSKRKSRRRRK